MDMLDTSFVADFPIVRVVWIDHALHNLESFVSISKMLRQCEEPALMSTIGYILEETEDYILLAQTLTSDGEVSEAMKVLKATIVEGPTEICPASTN